MTVQVCLITRFQIVVFDETCVASFVVRLNRAKAPTYRVKSLSSFHSQPFRVGFLGAFPMTTALYETDFYTWTLRQADLLRNEDYADLDLDNLIEEIEAMARSQRNQLTNRLRILLTHLLKLCCPPIPSRRGWIATIREQRRRIELLLKDSPSLRRELLDSVAYAYPRARQDAAQALDSNESEFPATCPWTVEQILDIDFLP